MSDIDQPIANKSDALSQGVHNRRGNPAYGWWLAGLLAVSLALTLASLYWLRTEALTNAAIEKTSLARILAEQTARTVQTIDQRLELAAVRLAHLEAAGRLNQASARELLSSEIGTMPFVRAMWMLDAQGRIEFDSDEGNIGISLADRDYFQVYQQRPDTEFYLGKPVRSRSVGSWLVSAARPLRHADGSLRGVLVVAVVPEYFSELWSSVLTEDGSIAVLFHRDGTLLMRSPMAEVVMGKSFADGLLFSQLLPRQPHGELESPTPYDGIHRLFSYRSLDLATPMVLVVGIGKDAVLAPWRQNAILALGFWAAACAVALVFFSRLRRLSNLNRRATDQAALAVARLTMASDAAGLVIWDWTLANDWWTVSPNHYSSLGLDAGPLQVSSAQWCALAHPDDHDIAEHAGSSPLAATGPYDYTLRLRHADGSYRWTHTTARVIERDDAGKATRLVGVRIDVSEQKRAELERAEMLDRVSDAYVALDKNWCYTFANIRAGEIFGRKPQDLIGKHIWTEFPQGRGQKFHLLYEQAMATQTPITAEEYYPPYDRWFENRIYPSASGLTIYFHDITDRKKAEQEAVLREQQLRRLIDGLGPSVFVILTGIDGRIVEANRVVRQAAGSAGEALAGVAVYALYGFNHASDTQLGLRHAVLMAAEGQPSRFDIVTRMADGAMLTLDMNVQPLYDAAGKVDLLVISASDVTQRVRATRALRESEEKYRSLVDLSPYAIVVHIDDHIVMANPAAARLFGASDPMALVGYAVDDLTHPGFRLSSAERRSRLRLSAETTQVVEEIVVLTLDGQAVDVQVSVGRTLFDGQAAIQAMLLDIGDRKRAERALAHSAAQLRATLDALPDLMFEVDALGEIHDYHSPRIDLLLVAPVDVVGTRVRDLMPPHSVATIMEGITLAVAHGHSSGQRYQLMLPDGVHWFELSCARKASISGEVFRVVVLARDISERVKMEISLRESEALMRQMAETVSQTFWLANLESGRVRRILYASPNFESMLGFAPRAMDDGSKTWLESIHVDDRKLVLMNQTRLAVTGSYDMQFRVCRAGKEPRWLHARAYPIRDSGGRLYRCTGVIDDISQRKSLELREETERRSLQLLNSHQPIEDLLPQIVALYEQLVPGMMGSILLLDASGEHLHHGAGNKLPLAYRDAIDGVRIGPNVGSCGTAAFTGEPALVSDIANDALWLDFKDLALAHGLRACWSVPIKSASGQVLGTVAFYFDHVRAPQADELAVIERAAQLMGHPIESEQSERQLRAADERSRSLVEWTPLGIAVVQDGKIVFANPACCAVFGAQTPAELLGKVVLSLIPPEGHALAKARMEKVLSGESLELVQRKYFKLDGSLMTVEGKAAPITFDGAPAIQFSLRDVTQELAALSALMDSRQRLRALSSQVLRTQETERRRIAHELHDELGQSLTAIKINLQAGQRVGAANSASVVQENIRIVEAALQHVRDLSLALRPSMLDDLGLMPALRWLGTQVGRRDGVSVQVRSSEEHSRLPPDIETACYRIAQEATTNVLRHARASRVDIELQVDGNDLTLTITDNGDGFDVQAMQERAIRGASAGLLGMRERATLLGGRLEIVSKPGAGCMVRLYCKLTHPSDDNSL